MSPFRIIPEPKNVVCGEGFHHLSGLSRIVIPGNGNEHAVALAEHLCRLIGKEVPVETGGADNTLLVISALTEGECACTEAPARREGYGIDLNSRQITVTGHDAAGFFYGIQTLRQIVEDFTTIPVCHIVDWPDMEIRGVHFDLKGCMPTFEYLKGAIARLAHYKINTILMEYEDKLVYRKHPALAARTALTLDQAKELSTWAERHHIQIIPLMQCLGHAEYILRHPEYAHLLEAPDHIQQMCPSAPETLELFKEVCEELFEVHPNSRYFHLGGDETRQLGECPRCSERAKTIGANGLLLEHLKKACEFLIRRGKTPIVWDDMLVRRFPVRLGELPKETIISYWLYDIASETQAYLAGEGTLLSRRWACKRYQPMPPLPKWTHAYFEDLPEERLAFLRAQAGSDNFPEKMSSTLFLKYIKEKGFDVLGASAAQCSTDGIAANPERAIPNIRTWATLTKREKGLGVVSTSWTRSGSLTPVNGIMEGMWYPFVASGEYYWTADGVSEELFDRKFNKRFYGLDGQEATDAIWLTRHRNLTTASMNPRKIFSDLSKRAERNKEHLAYYGLVSDLLAFDKWISALCKNDASRNFYTDVHRGGMTARNKNAFATVLGNCRKQLANLKEEMTRVYANYLPSDEVEDCVASFFGWHECVLAAIAIHFERPDSPETHLPSADGRVLPNTAHKKHDSARD